MFVAHWNTIRQASLSPCIDIMETRQGLIDIFIQKVNYLKQNIMIAMVAPLPSTTHSWYIDQKGYSALL